MPISNSESRFMLRAGCNTMNSWSIPYWFLLGHAFFHNEIELFYQPFIHLADFRDIDFGRDFQLWEVVTLGYLFILYIVSTMNRKMQKLRKIRKCR